MGMRRRHPEIEVRDSVKKWDVDVPPEERDTWRCLENRRGEAPPEALQV